MNTDTMTLVKPKKGTSGPKTLENVKGYTKN